MDQLKHYVLMLGALLIFQSLIEGLLPSHVSRKYIRVVLSAIFLLVLLTPLRALLSGTPLDWDRDKETGTEAGVFESRVQQMTAEEYARILTETGLPEEWAAAWQLEKIEVDCTAEGLPEQIRVWVCSRETAAEKGKIRVRLGGIGAGQDEDETEQELSRALGEFWGADPSRIRVRAERE